MRTEDVLAATATGLWRWDSGSGTFTLDAEAARLLELPAGGGVFRESAVRSRFHPVDWNEIYGVVNLALSEGTLAEARLRIVDGTGRVLRTVRSRAKPFPPERPDGRGHILLGTLQEVAEPHPGTTGAPATVTGDWRRSREAFLLDAGRALAEARSTEEVLRVAASLSMPGFSPDGLAVFGIAGERLTVVGHHGHSVGDEDPFTDMPLETDYPAAEVVRTGRAIYLPSPEDYSRRYPVTWPLASRFGRRSWAFLPLIVAGRTMGAWMAGFKHPVSFTPDERSVLTTVARMLAQALTRAGVAETERELSLGLQRSMMPTLGPDIPGMTVAARYIPTGGGLQVGGDWYDMIPLPNGRIALVIGDVQGHDVRAAGLMGQLRIALRAYAAEGHRPDAVLSRASRFLSGLTDAYEDGEETGPRFATCLYAETDPETGTLDIARAGHPDPVVITADGTAMIHQTEGGMPLGVETDADYPTSRLTLEPGETIMLCTDGLIETGGHDMFSGWDRLRPVLEQQTADLEKLADALVQAVHGPTSHYTTGPLADRREDDIALLLLRCDGGTRRRPAPRRTALTIAQAEPERIAAARQQLRELLHDWADPEQVDAAVLMISEMATNVLVHTDGDALMLAQATGEHGERRLRVEVSDGSDELPHRRRPGEMASSGRGLVLMEMLADAWGVDPRGAGKSIWFELYESGPES
ncbi:SpoIIE family protein phosphatase [Streptomyces sp. NBC_00053]|uniref:ATP-binding SpoIIE family protein phosphatase n=1 Tax=unclassified Streptomyces TaxID=2593676 RepID=UPI000F5BAC6B|nr:MULTISPECIES: SpoIIE family protein phosphatase [unclassified Streptomyces]WSX02560.1 SpoIIE family protein phosphatase [Streptomyces sp. NBC_00987]MCX5101850.1 SpoIIE family protein phosphatase [Streptomyces sp. NBC_00439]MCX5501643.1 SpoIIE family protein phosphatase [Streptomyces sp. NBC_00052]MCX5549822.1 SpoIIE family protein phosphatase [Streptomyces sp. NBC_00051]RPK68363.1 Phosphoserine phosphatase RsbU [Streptomyces sp. ADI95-17]